MSLTQKNDNSDHRKKSKPIYGVNHRSGRPIKPLSPNLKLPSIASSAIAKSSQKASPAVELIRRKVEELYAKEPSATDELTAASKPNSEPKSKHQQFMYELSTSGKSLATIQTQWHNYYVNLPDHEKHEVWQEFYQAAAKQPSTYGSYLANGQIPVATSRPESIRNDSFERSRVFVGSQDHSSETKTKQKVRDIKKQIVNHVAAGSQTKLKARHHFQSLAFGLGLGSFVLIIFLFSFFNEIIIAPLIQPSRNDQNTPIILSSADVAPSSTPQVIIPKINVQIPVIYNETSVSDTDIQNSLEDGVLHYPTTSLPGQQGNAAFFGHSSNNIFNPGKYKFAFVLLHTLVPGDVFYLTYNDKVYAYKVFNREVVSPSDVSVLDSVPGQVATATLITCDPPGTSINRLVVWGEQISPAPTGDIVPTPITSPQAVPTHLASDGPSLWSRFSHWVENIF